MFSGSAHPKLAAEICGELGEPLLPVRVRRFANDCLEVQLQSNCRERDVFLIQPLSPPVQDNLVELLLMLDAARGASAARVTAVIPHYAYARSDKKHMPRVSIGGRMVADLLVSAGASRVLTMTLHSSQVHGFFSVPVDHLHALRELASHFRGQDLTGTVVVSPDLGNAKSAAAFAARLGLPVAANAKKRIDDRTVRITSIIGDVATDGIVLDEIAPGHHADRNTGKLRGRVTSVRIVCTHGCSPTGHWTDRRRARGHRDRLYGHRAAARPRGDRQVTSCRWPRPHRRSGGFTSGSRSARCSASTERWGPGIGGLRNSAKQRGADGQPSSIARTLSEGMRSSSRLKGLPLPRARRWQGVW